MASEFSEVLASSPRQASEELGPGTSVGCAVRLMAMSALALALVLALVGCNNTADDDDAPLGTAAVAAVAAAANMLSVRALQVFQLPFLASSWATRGMHIVHEPTMLFFFPFGKKH